jgi:predicted nuclease of predicted toxin-antitoxin system
VKLLLDQNLSFKLCARLTDVFPGSMQARLVGLDRADDRTLWDHAAQNGFVLVTQDADFAEMAALYGPPPKVVWLRGGNQPTGAVEATLRRGHELILAFVQDEDAACLELRQVATQPTPATSSKPAHSRPIVAWWTL